MVLGLLEDGVDTCPVGGVRRGEVVGGRERDDPVESGSVVATTGVGVAERLHPDGVDAVGLAVGQIELGVSSARCSRTGSGASRRR